MFAMGAAAFAFIAVANTTIQLTSAPEMRGRVMALYAIAFLGSTPIGGPIVGWISQQYGAAVRLRDRRDRDDRRDGVGRLVARSATAPRAVTRPRRRGGRGRVRERGRSRLRYCL